MFSYKSQRLSDLGIKCHLMRPKRNRTEPTDACVTPGVFFLLAGSVLSNFIN